MFKELAYYDGKTGTPDEVMIPLMTAHISLAMVFMMQLLVATM